MKRDVLLTPDTSWFKAIDALQDPGERAVLKYKKMEASLARAGGPG
jgi:hypothetical protein